jgi:2-dehydro-3-deoxygluconokinase
MTPVPEAALDAVALGEGQLRLSTPLGEPLVDTRRLSVTVAGTEGNVLGLLARLGRATAIVTALPATPFGRKIESSYRQAGIDTAHVIWRPSGRVGLYFVEQAAAPVPSQVIYDREGSCFAQLSADDIDWQVFASARLAHNSGITAALTDRSYELVRTAVDVARSHHRTVSVDVNYRSRLWGPRVAAGRLAPILKSADIVFCSCRDADALFGLGTDAPGVAAALADRFGARTVLVSNGPRALAVIHDGQPRQLLPPPVTVVDRIGAGDALLGAFLHCMLNDDPAGGLRLGMAAACLALTRHGDQLLTTLGELRALEASLGTGPDIIR